MNATLVVSYALLIILLWLMIGRRTIAALAIRKQLFTCTRCGHCCRLRVNLEPEDIPRLEAIGKKDFVETIKGRPYLKQVNGYCPWMDLKDGKARCTVYEHRPKICRDFPKARKWGMDCWDPRCKAFTLPRWARL